MSSTIVTNAGITAAINAGTSGPLINVTSVQFGSDIITPNATMTGVYSGGTQGTAVYTASAGVVSYNIIDANTISYKVILNESVGNFNVGNIGLFLSNGTMFTISALDTVTNKFKNSGTVAGNVRAWYIIVRLTNVAAVINVTLQVLNNASLPEVATFSALPSPGSTPYNAYLVDSDPLFNGVASFATKQGGVWRQTPTQDWLSTSRYLTASTSLDSKALQNITVDASSYSTPTNMYINLPVLTSALQEVFIHRIDNNSGSAIVILPLSGQTLYSYSAKVNVSSYSMWPGETIVLLGNNNVWELKNLDSVIPEVPNFSSLPGVGVTNNNSYLVDSDPLLGGNASLATKQGGTWNRTPTTSWLNNNTLISSAGSYGLSQAAHNNVIINVSGNTSLVLPTTLSGITQVVSVARVDGNISAGVSIYTNTGDVFSPLNVSGSPAQRFDLSAGDRYIFMGYNGSWITYNISKSTSIAFITSSQSYTLPPNADAPRVTVIGGGGGGAGCTPSGSNYISGGGGGAGGTSKVKIYGAKGGDTLFVTVGTGGAGGDIANGNGGNGGTSSFGSYLSASGGTGAVWTLTNSSNGGVGGQGFGTGALTIFGGDGSDGMNTNVVATGNGGASSSGGGGRAGVGGGMPGRSYGSGGGGNYLFSGGSGGGYGGAGASGIIILEF